MDILRWFRHKDRRAEPGERAPLRRYVAHRPKVWAVGGGKGGVGKTMVASSLGVILASCGKRVLIVDADFGAANLHTFFGVQGARSSLSNFLKGETADFESLVVDSGVMNLFLACGGKDSLDVADLNEKGVAALRSVLFRAPYDYVLLDIGPGTGASNLDLFLMAQTGVVVTTAEPTSVENSYRFLKCLLLRRMREAVMGSEDTALKNALTRVFSGATQRVKTISDILLQLKQMDPEKGELLSELMGGMRIGVIVNGSSGTVEPEFGPSLERACADYFGVGISHIGDIGRDEKVPESVRLKKPLMVHAPESEAARDLRNCFERLCSSGEKAGERPAEGVMS